ncbi:MAG: beta-lactamase family protein [Chloroflexi bacterium]|nr:beta-lactamase family protein [Chloroflexota bacterium]
MAAFPYGTLIAYHHLAAQPQEAAMSPTPFTNNGKHRSDNAALLPAAFQEFREQRHIPGLAYGLVTDGELVAAGGLGVQNILDQSPVTPDSVFRIASMTKSFTAMAVVRLRDAGKFHLDCPAEQFVPELAGLLYPTHDSAPITIRQLLTMSAGFPQDDPWADRQLACADAELSAWLSQGVPFSNPPGVTFEYSNYGYAILGRIIANVTGVPYQTYIQDELLTPLGMMDTTFDVRRVAPERLVMGYRREGSQWVAEPPLADGAFGAMGGLFTTIADFARYMAFLLSAFPPRDEPETGPVRRSSLREMQQMWRHNLTQSTRLTPDAPALVQTIGYGYGLGIQFDSVLGYSVAHGGGLPGYGSFYRLLPDYGVGLVAFANLTYESPAARINDILYCFRQAGALQPRKWLPPDALLAVQSVLAQVYEHWDDQTITAVATASFFQDCPLERRRQQFADLRARFGRCRAITPLEPENALRGRWRLLCRGGYIELFATLAPTVPPQLQYLQITAARSLTPALKRTAAQVVKLINRWDDETARTVLHRKLKRAALRSQLAALRVQYGKLRLGDVLEGDGTTRARLRLPGQHGQVDMTLTADPTTGTVLTLAFTRPRETAFVP